MKHLQIKKMELQTNHVPSASTQKYEEGKNEVLEHFENISKRKPRYESIKMTLNQAQD